MRLFTSFLFVVLVGSCLQRNGHSAEHPNVLFIAIDDLNDWIGCMKGHPQALTPNIDRLAARGVLFTNAHCTATACNPSRAAVFSGRMPQVTGVWSNSSGPLSKHYRDAQIIPICFAEAGYRTLGTGKLMHRNAIKFFDDYLSVDQRWSPLGGQAAAYTHEELPSKGSTNPRHLVKDSRGHELILPLNRMPSDRNPGKQNAESFDWGPIDVPDSEYGETQITDWAIEYLNKKSDQPVFLGVGYYRPHQPLWAPQRFFDRFKNSPGQLPQVFENDLDDLSDAGRKWAIEAVTSGLHSTVVKYEQWRPAVEAYLACISYVDHEVGRLLDALDNSTFGDNTLVILWSDHGWHLGEKEHWGKWTGWERSTRVPLIIVPPKSKSGQYALLGSECDRPVGLIDLYPTLVDICGIDGPEALDGQSLVPLLQNPAMDTERTVVTMFDPDNASLRSQHFRYIHYADGSEELYDHRTDPNEWHNVVDNRQHDKPLALLRDAASPYLSTSDKEEQNTTIQLDPESQSELSVPPLSCGDPAAGKRVIVTPAEYQGTEVFHTVFLPADWKQGGPAIPIIFEYTGNYFPKSGSTGEPEDGALGYCLSAGKFIWVSLPYISQDHKDNAITWWGDKEATVRYAKQNVPRIIKRFGADPDTVFLCGFSRGAIGVNYLGLYDDEVAKLWTAFITHDHFDGVKQWGGTNWGSPLETYRSGASERLRRVGKRPYLVSQNGSSYGSEEYIRSVLPDVSNFTFSNVNTGEIFGQFPNELAKSGHTDRWPLKPSKSRAATWKWMNTAARSNKTTRTADGES